MAENTSIPLEAQVTTSYKRKVRFKAGTDLAGKPSLRKVDVDVIDATDDEYEHLIIQLRVQSSEAGQESNA